MNRIRGLRFGDAQLLTSVSGQRVARAELLRDAKRQLAIESAIDINLLELAKLRLWRLGELFRSRARSAFSVSACELTETYSPAAMDIAPATKPASPASKTAFRPLCAAATPTTSDAVETIPSLAPKTAARSQPMRWVKCCST